MRTISTEDLKHDLEMFEPIWDDWEKYWILFKPVIEQIIDNQPTVNSENKLHAHWVGDIEGCQCSNCKSHQNLASRYCPYCGARMDEEVHR